MYSGKYRIRVWVLLFLWVLIVAMIWVKPLSVQAAMKINDVLPGRAGPGDNLSSPEALKGMVTGKVVDPDKNVSNNGKAGVLVRFWKWGTDENPVKTTTNNDGIYQIELGNGNWIGCACGSPDGYEPLFWTATIRNGKVITFSEVNQISPKIIDKSHGQDYDEGRSVCFWGSGFGCSGKVVIEISGGSYVEVTEVDIINIAHPNPKIRERLCFTFPFINNESAHGWMIYVHGAMKSNSIPFDYRYAGERAPDGTQTLPEAGQGDIPEGLFEAVPEGRGTGLLDGNGGKIDISDTVDNQTGPDISGNDITPDPDVNIDQDSTSKPDVTLQPGMTQQTGPELQPSQNVDMQKQGVNREIQQNLQLNDLGPQQQQMPQGSRQQGGMVPNPK